MPIVYAPSDSTTPPRGTCTQCGGPLGGDSVHLSTSIEGGLGDRLCTSVGSTFCSKTCSQKWWNTPGDPYQPVRDIKKVRAGKDKANAAGEAYDDASGLMVSDDPKVPGDSNIDLTVVSSEIGRPPRVEEHHRFKDGLELNRWWQS